MSSVTRICPSHWGEAPIPITGTGEAAVISRATGSSVPSSTKPKAPASATARASSAIFFACAWLRPCVR